MMRELSGLLGYPEEVLFDWPGMVRRALIVHLGWPEDMVSCLARLDLRAHWEAEGEVL